MSDAAEAIAKVVADLRRRRVYDRYDVVPPEQMWKSIEQSVVVDATMIYHDLLKKEGVKLYEDHRVCPVWPNALVGYHNEHGNAIVMHTVAMDRSEYDDTEWERSVNLWSDIVKSPLTRNPWETNADTHVIDWDRVRWVYNITLFVGGRSKQIGGPMPTTGPCHMFRLAVYPDGEIADIRWIALDSEGGAREGYAMGKLLNNPTGERWDMAQLIVLGALNLGNCVNVELMEPKRSRAESRRIERTGVRVSELHVRPISKSYRGKGKGAEPLGTVPIHSVRGHFAEYGMNGRGLLFGKYAGRFWIPAHARGNPERGAVEQSYVLEV